jgi:hypothetical protein
MGYTLQFEPGPVIDPLESREDLVRARCAGREDPAKGLLKLSNPGIMRLKR